MKKLTLIIAMLFLFAEYALSQNPFTVSAGTSGDAVLTIEADTDNNNEGDNAVVKLRHDGGNVGINMGFDQFGDNVFGIGRVTGTDHWDTFMIDRYG